MSTGQKAFFVTLFALTLFGGLRASNAWATDANIFVFLSDSRTASDVTVTIDATDSATSTHYSDWEAAGGSLPGTASGTKYSSLMTLFSVSQNALQGWYFGTIGCVSNYNYSCIGVNPFWSTTFSNVRVTVRAYINGYCHEDYQDISTWSSTQNIYLYFNGNGASWDGSCYRGDMLRTTP